MEREDDVATADRYPLPYGIDDLDAVVRKQKETGKVKCVVRGCARWLVPPSRKAFTGEVCPEHGIQVHASGTFSYRDDYRRNLIVDGDYFEQHVRRHPFKYEAHRFGSEKSEDALTWNVLRSLQRADCLKELAALCMGVMIPREPRLFLWGLELQGGGAKPWDFLIQARERFESDLPEGRPKTEPDIGLFLPGQYLILLEAKFTSPNGTYERDKKTKLFDLTIDQLVNIYQDRSLQILNYEVARGCDRILYQLWRNMTFAEFMAARDGTTTKAYHANLVRKGYEEVACGEFLPLIRPEYHDRFEQITWEDIYCKIVRGRRSLPRLAPYMRQKTEGLRRAFQLSESQEKEN